MPVQVIMGAVKFTERDVDLILKVLPAGIPPRKLQLLPRILRDWADNDLATNLDSETPGTRRARIKRLDALAHSALRLLDALDAANRSDDDFCVIREMAMAKQGRMTQQNRNQLQARLDEERAFLAELSSAAKAASATWKQGKGHPRNIKALLVILDIAGLFRWLTGKTATRQVSRDDDTPTGPFWDFAAALWPIIFGKGDDGLQAAIKNLASAQRKGSRSAVLANIDLRHPAWRVFEE
jgi:hypothetical protein